MNIIYVLIPIAVLLTAVGIYLFFWAVKTEQFEDLEKQGMSILYDENSINEESKSEKNSESLAKSHIEQNKHDDITNQANQTKRQDNA